MMDGKTLKRTDPEVFRAIQAEIVRERDTLVMIASENYASRAVMEAQASVMTNKYAEGYPDARYYGGCELVDEVERLAVERAKRLFGADYVNVQPHSGSQANMAVYLGFLEPGDLILGMDLAQGGHLTHGSGANFSGKIYRALFYGVNPETGYIDYDQVRDMAKKERPRIIVAGASAYPRLIDFHLFQDIAQETGAYLMADMAHIAGLVAVGLHPSPVGTAHFITSTTHKTLRGPRGGLILSAGTYGQELNRSVFPGIQGGPLMHVIAAKAVAFEEALGPEFAVYQRQVVKNAKALARELKGHGFDVVTGGTDNHLVLVDLTKRGMTGQEAEVALGQAGLVANKNRIPFDKRGPKVTSGIRLGTPAITTRGVKEEEITVIGQFIKEVLENPESHETLRKVRSQVRELCNRFPIYRYLDEEC